MSVLKETYKSEIAKPLSPPLEKFQHDFLMFGVYGGFTACGIFGFYTVLFHNNL